MAQQDLARINLKSISPNPHGGPLSVCVAPQREREREVKNMYRVLKNIHKIVNFVKIFRICIEQNASLQIISSPKA